ncbi:unnamed protein product [Owenia fusiformis]|uniref:Uncharacterized protein n=1 Tax=Owenia fusiformis TaxID=6347 RepID=A0A8S4Q1T0_OWEFU|nr:unnamed protein product [Owenia fusiformis]
METKVLPLMSVLLFAATLVYTNAKRDSGESSDSGPEFGDPEARRTRQSSVPSRMRKGTPVQSDIQLCSLPQDCPYVGDCCVLTDDTGAGVCKALKYDSEDCLVANNDVDYNVKSVYIDCPCREGFTCSSDDPLAKMGKCKVKRRQQSSKTTQTGVQRCSSPQDCPNVGDCCVLTDDTGSEGVCKPLKDDSEGKCKAA